MSLPIIGLMMIAAGIMGGIVNYLLPSNYETPGKVLRGVFHCIGLGIGATILVPLFLEIAQSKLLDKINTKWTWQCQQCPDCGGSMKTAKEEPARAVKDSVATNADEKKKPVKEKAADSAAGDDSAQYCVPLKNYFLYAAYCFLAASAGSRFINGLTDSVLKEKQIEDLKKINNKTEEEKQVVERQKNKLDAHNKERLKEDENKVRNELTSKGASLSMLYSLGPITNPDDPQKGRFGGKSSVNDRSLKAKVKELDSGLFNVTVWVESIDAEKPLVNEVIFYLHDSFSPSVYAISPDEFKDGKALDDEIISYGAFTVGAVADNGKTLLELDLSDQTEFPKEFRER